MRDILDKFKLLESTGLANRKSGDVFKNSQGQEMTFSGINFYPEEGGKYDEAQLNELITKLGPNIKWQNKQPKFGGVAVATFDTADGQVQYGFYKQEISPNRLENKISNEVDGYKFAGKSAEKIQSGLTPQDLLSQRDNLTSEQIVSQLEQKLGADNPLVEVAKQVAGGAEFPLKFPAPPGVSFTGFRDYFCEILQPMALQNGQYTGNAGEAAEIFLGGSFSGTTISFDAAKNAGLSDSILTNKDGKSVKISTKGGTGAQASSKNLIDSIDELSETDGGKKILEKYSDTIDLIREVQSQGQINAPLWLGVKYDVISQDEAQQILNLRKLPPVNLENIDQLKLSDNLKKLARERKTDTPEKTNLFYHLLAAVAFEAAQQVNSKTDFSKAATEILNNSALVQVYTTMRDSKDTWTLEPFKTVFPGKSIKGVDLSASKNYFSTGVKGNFTFKIDRGAGPKESSAKAATTTDISPSVDTLQTIDKSITEPRFKRDRKPRPEPKSDLGPAGRTLRNP